MQNAENITEEFRNQIDTELGFCDPTQTPVICAQLSDPASRATIVGTIAQACISGNLSIAQGIVAVEREFSTNPID